MHVCASGLKLLAQLNSKINIFHQTINEYYLVYLSWEGQASVKVITVS